MSAISAVTLDFYRTLVEPAHGLYRGERFHAYLRSAGRQMCKYHHREHRGHGEARKPGENGSTDSLIY